MKPCTKERSSEPLSLSHEPQNIWEKILISSAKAIFSIDYGNRNLFQKLEEQTDSIDDELIGKLAEEMMLERFKQAQRPSRMLKVNQQLMRRGPCAKLAHK